MARLPRLSLSSGTPPLPDTTISINLNRMLVRLQQILINPKPEIDSRLRSSGAEREKVAANIQAAQDLLVRLEEDVKNVKIQSKKQETQTDLTKKRQQLLKLEEVLEEFNEIAQQEQREGDSSSEGEDLLGEDTPSEETSSHASHADPESATSSPTRLRPTPIIPEIPPATTTPIPPIQEPTPIPEPESTLRNRNARAELLTPAATSTGISTATTEALLSHNRAEQEALTQSMLNMAVSLKQSSRSFAASLEEEKSTLDSATKGLDKNELGLEAATRKMGLLRGFTEGRGWLGRMIMYAWIFGLMIIAILVVFVMPKLRF